MRAVQIYKHEQVQDSETKKWTNVISPDCLAVSHGFGVDFEEFETGAVSYSTVICELSDGSIRNVPVQLVKFITPMVPT